MCYMGWVSDREIPQYLKVLSSALKHLNLTEQDPCRMKVFQSSLAVLDPELHTASHGFQLL